MEFIDLELGDPRLDNEILPVLLELRPNLSAASFAAIYAEGYPQGLRFTGMYDGGSCVAVGGWRIVATTFDTRKLYVDDLVTASAVRSRGHGATLLQELVRRAEEAGCTTFDLDSGVHRLDAHAFYFREGLRITAHHFARKLDRSDG